MFFLFIYFFVVIVLKVQCVARSESIKGKIPSNVPCAENNQAALEFDYWAAVGLKKSD